METKKVLEEINKRFPEKIKEISVQFGEEIISIDKKSLLDIAKFLVKDPYAFTMLLDLTCVDYEDQKERFQMIYHFFSIKHNLRLRLKASLTQEDLSVDSMTSLWKNANWLEREVFDMFGVHFNGHPDLRRIFMYDGFEGYPLRKDYPLRKRQPRIRLRK